MGLYYQTPLTFLGAQQPLTPRKRVPPSGPVPSNPVFGALSRASTLVVAWTAVAAPLPQTNLGIAAFAAAPGNVLMGQACM